MLSSHCKVYLNTQLNLCGEQAVVRCREALLCLLCALAWYVLWRLVNCSALAVLHCNQPRWGLDLAIMIQCATALSLHTECAAWTPQGVVCMTVLYQSLASGWAVVPAWLPVWSAPVLWLYGFPPQYGAVLAVQTCVCWLDASVAACDAVL